MPLVTAFDEQSGAHAGLVRDARGWLGGVCAALAGAAGIRVTWIRLGFAVGALIGGLGIAVYLGCWLIIPAAGDTDARGPRWIVAAAGACGAAAGLAVLAVVAAVATVFGFGWIPFAVAAAVLLAVLAGWRRLGPAWALLPIAALTLPAIAVAASGIRLAPRFGHTVIAPRTLERGASYRSGLDWLLVDLRHTALPAAGTVRLRIDGGLRRTIVALPHDRCVRVVVHYDADQRPARLVALLTDRSSPLYSDLDVFGRLYDVTPQVVTSPSAISGPLLDIDFHSEGGSLYVRDYPASVDPDALPDWPGFAVTPESRPDVRGTPRRAAARLLAAWRTRRAAQAADARRVNGLMPGPCVPPAAAPTAGAPRRSPAHGARTRRRLG